MGRVGVYGVSIFYILSGLTLYYVYHSKMIPSKVDVLEFLKKRAFRIFPLLWLAIISSILISGKWPGFLNLLLNLSGIFGFVKWDGYLTTGAWSIGNELVFYIFFIIFIFCIKKSTALFISLSIVVFLVYVFFAFNLLSPQILLIKQWRDYVNPLNQVFLFLGGVLIGYIFHKKNINRYVVFLILLVGVFIFIFYPSQKYAISIVTGWPRLVFTISCFMICFSFYKMDIKPPSFINNPLMFLGEISYSLYLLHPIVYDLVGMILAYLSKNSLKFPTFFQVIISFILSLVVSYFSYNYYEKYFMKLVKPKNEILRIT